MNTYIFLYNETSFFEVNLVAYFMKTVGDVHIVTEYAETICTNEGVRILADISLDDMKADEVDVFVICGGETANIKDKDTLAYMIRACREKNKIIGGICAGSKIVMDALEIDEEVSTTNVIDERIVLSPGNEYVDFALEIGRAAGIYADEADYQETVEYFKHFKLV